MGDAKKDPIRCLQGLGCGVVKGNQIFHKILGYLSKLLPSNVQVLGHCLGGNVDLAAKSKLKSHMLKGEADKTRKRDEQDIASDREKPASKKAKKAPGVTLPATTRFNFYFEHKGGFDLALRCRRLRQALQPLDNIPIEVLEWVNGRLHIDQKLIEIQYQDVGNPYTGILSGARQVFILRLKTSCLDRLSLS
ncbi:hypothetical protein BGW36DRAFT_360420 [Talaromyces proteolyticus]|uniref:Uncharacterized protein n=1 Tax=Talaromyces proteolyticus TaxID=1131652 RepID=A0AAD4KNB5_9EURO|nr:uncharacterized protein BGW36DRAFT_360420 [Talaromyces proteolyticus]KAH8696597.1 hypothetical protein BGW36DRAFT_360420 [Talaromyces proteolyticus]